MIVDQPSRCPGWRFAYPGYLLFSVLGRRSSVFRLQRRYSYNGGNRFGAGSDWIRCSVNRMTDRGSA
jgi:hypothetical protein